MKKKTFFEFFLFLKVQKIKRQNSKIKKSSKNEKIIFLNFFFIF